MNNSVKIIVALGFVGGGLLSASEVEDAIRVASADVLDRKLPAIEVKHLEATIPRPRLVSELASAIAEADSPVVELVACRMLLDMEPFPFQDIKHLQLKPDAPSVKRAYLLFLLNEGASGAEQVSEVIQVAKIMLSDKGKGTHRYGEARAYSAHGLRVCDVAYNVLVTRLPLTPPMMPVDVDNFVPDERDALIVELAERASIRLTTDTPSGDRSSQTSANAPPIVQLPAPKKASNTTPKAATLSEEPPSSKPWRIIVVLIVAALGLLWWLLKKRK